jgi:hypothetical protein
MGKLAFLSHMAQPNISFTIHKLSHHLNTWNEDHWKAMKRVLCYLWGMLDYAIGYKGKYYNKGQESPLLQVYCDSNHTSNIKSQKLMMGFVVLLCGRPISWCV